jgi:hypothetical protein
LLTSPYKAGSLFYLGKVMLECRSEGRLGNGPFHLFLLRLLGIGINAINAVRIGMIAVKAELVPDIEDEKEAKGNPDRQPEDIEQTIPFIPLEIPEGDKNQVL